MNAYQPIDSTECPLFDEPVDPSPRSHFEPQSIQQRFEEFHARHPEVYRHIVRLARQAKDRGRERYSIDAIIQLVRWHFDMEKEPSEKFLINDHYSSRFARKVMEQEPDLADFFETRGLKHV